MRTVKRLYAALAAAALLGGAMRPAGAEVVTVFGDTTFGPGYARASPHGGPTPGFVTAVKYRAFDVTVSQSDWMYTFVTHCEFNCVSFVYEGGFDPLQPRDNMVASDGTDGWQLTTLMAAMEPGRHYTYVVAGFYDFDWGAFGTTVGGSGLITISAVPEPAGAALLLGGLGTLAVAGRRRRRAA